MKSNWVAPPKLYEVRDRKGNVELAWIPDPVLKELIAMYGSRGYKYTLLASCKELVESWAYRKDKSRGVIAKEDFQDVLIDLHQYGKMESAS